MSEVNNTSANDDIIEQLSKLNETIINSLDQAEKLSSALVEDSIPILKNLTPAMDDSAYLSNDEKVRHIREQNQDALKRLNQAKSLSLMIVDSDCGFTSLDADTQHHYLTALDEKVTQARGLQQGIKMLCG